MPKITSTLIQQMRADRSSGQSVRDVATKYGVHTSTVSRHTKPADEPSQSVEIPTAELTSRAEEFFATPTRPVIDNAPPPQLVADFFRGLDVDEPQQPQPPKPQPVLPQRTPSTQEIIQRVLLNVETFPELFPSPPTHETLSKKSPADLSALLATMEHTRTVASLTAQFKNVFFVATRATEVLGAAVLKLKTQGMTDALMQQQQELSLIFKEIAIKHADKFQTTTEPEIRLLMLFGMTLLQTDATNRLRERMAAPKETEEKYKDL